ncbi:MAG TPA: YiiX/YebB-like N1pC/P60 family cysteine hydrolase [Smithellaceae bacterium]|jgi:hypothetical protein|nr:leucine-rich repeat protein [Smithella sp.]HPV49452.1 YiiX/YebB-like N1pC/P60 family cysteine hydrolase [Smithellaceae bacterium]
MKTIDHHTDHAGIAHIISAMIEGMKIIRSVSIIFFTVTLFLSAFAVSASGENVTHNLVSVCSRTEQVRVAIQKEVDIQRFTSGAAGVVRCDTIKDYELKKIEYLQIIEKDITSLKPGDFEGLEGLKMLNLEGNKLQSLDSSVFSGLTNLENLVLARNPLIALQDELRVLTHLKRFDCSDCQLSEISTAAFGDNLELESVFLADNQLSQLPDGIFQNNDHLRIVDLSGNRFVQIPALFASEKSPLEAFDISRNLITVPDLSPLSRFQKLQVVNLSNNTFDSPDLQDTSVQMADHSFRIITSHDNRSIPFLNKISLPDSVALASSATAVQGVERLRFFVRSHWHVPLEISTSFSTAGNIDLRNPGIRAKEERLLLRQLEEFREAYRRAAFDFFDISIRFVAADSYKKAPALRFNSDKIGIDIVLKASAQDQNGSSVISDEQILEELADHFKRSRSIVWYANESPQDLLKALTRDYEKIARMDDELRFDNIRLVHLIDTAMERMKEAGGKKFFSDSELTDARLIQFRMILTFQRLENTMARWRLAESDPEFPYRSEVRLLLCQASGMYRTYLDWFLNTVVGDRAMLNVFDKTLYRTNPIFKILDSEVPPGFFNLDGRVSTRIPHGAVRDLIKSRLSAPLLHFLYGMRSLDRKVSPADIERSPLCVQMQEAANRIATNRRSLKQHHISDMRAFRELWETNVKNSVKFPLYRVTMSLASLIGDTRLSHPMPAITDEQIADMKAHLKPGDILIERMDYYLSNAFLGGFWPHAILYLGPKEAWSRLRLADGTTLAEDPWIFKNILPNYHAIKDERPALVIEAISQGVVFNSLEEAAQKDYIAIFRPKFAEHEQEAKIATAIRRALKYHGRPYDFDFDFFTDDKLVCTELVYRAYHPDINFLVQKQAIQKPDPPIPGMIKIAGRDTMPASEIVKLALYMLENKQPNRSIGYTGQTLELVRLYMKQGKNGDPARVYEGNAGIEALKNTLK